MRRVALTTIGVIASLLLLAGVASAASPAVGPVSIVNVQGVSALAKAEVNPGGLETSYVVEYVDQAGFAASGYAGASKTPPVVAGDGSTTREVRAPVSGLSPDTTYHVRLVATNASGSDDSETTFTTTHGFGFLPGSEGFGVRAIADGGGPASAAGSHPYRLNIDIGLERGRRVRRPARRLVPRRRHPRPQHRNAPRDDPQPVDPPDLLCRRLRRTARSPLRGVSLGRELPRRNPGRHGRRRRPSRGGGETRRFGLFNLDPPPGVAAQLGFAPYGCPGRPRHQPARGGGRGLPARLCGARNIPQSLDVDGLAFDLWGIPGPPRTTSNAATA